MNTPTAGNNAAAGGGWTRIVMIIILVGLAVTAIYFLYKFLYTSDAVKATVLVPGKQSAAAVDASAAPAMPTPFEGGQYTFSTWAYINSFNKGLNQRKHIFEIKGDNFSTLIVGLGAFRNTLVVRTYNKDIVVGEGFQGLAAPTEKARKAMEAFADKGGSANAGTPNSADKGGGSLSKTDVDALFVPLTSEDSLLDTPPMCDLPEIDMQRWVLVTVVLSGRTIDVYLDGKLARSCVTKSYYKVDPTGVKPVICGRGGFDGYISNMAVANYAMNPDEIYRTYLSGPEGGFSNTLDWATSMFKGSSV